VTYSSDQGWQSLGDLLFVDLPVGSGWSNGERSLSEIADEFVVFLDNFYREFPERKNSELILSSECFQGSYLLSITKAILDHNLLTLTDDQINVRRVI
jgi:carboxypeptidase D